MLLDTTVCIDLLRETKRREDGPACAALRRLADTPLYLSFFSVCELYTGVELSGEPDRERRAVRSLLDRLTVISPDETFPVIYAEAAAHLLKRGLTIPVMDLLIGITAKSHGLPVLTRDAEHFGRIPGLTVERY